MLIRPDNIQFTSQLPNYINIGTPTADIAISGSVLSGNTANFLTTIQTPSTATRYDIYGKNQNNGSKQLLSTSNYLSNDSSPGGGIYQHISTEFAQLVTAQSSGVVIVEISVFNGTGGTIILVNQTITISVVEYQIPF